MELKELKENWEELGEKDAYWAVLSDPAKINNKWNLKVFYRTGEELLDNVVRGLNTDNRIRFGKVLDFGCGPGRITQALASRSLSVTGVDISSTMIAKAQDYNKYPGKCQYLVNSKNDLAQLGTATFDFVFSYITLQHISPEYSKNYIKEFIRVTKPGGHILFNLPTKAPLFFRVVRGLIGTWGINHLRRIYYKKSSVIEMHAVPQKEIRDVSEANGTKVISITADNRIGMGWESCFYLLKKI